LSLEHEDGIVFLYNLRDGAANQSYGIQVAALAGVPKRILDHARTRLKKLEREGRHPNASGVNTDQIPLFNVKLPHHPVVDKLRQLEPDILTPKQALAALYELKGLV